MMVEHDRHPPGEPSQKRRRLVPPPTHGQSSSENESVQRRRDSKTRGNRRSRAVLSCSECTRRKQKCDRKEPCSQCVSRNVSHLCTPVADLEDDAPTSLQRIENRMESMEAQMVLMVSLLSASSSNGAPMTDLPMAADKAGLPDTSGWGSHTHRLIRLDRTSNPGLEPMLTLIRKSGVTITQLGYLLAGIPGRRLSDDLVDFYFRDVNWTRYPIHQPYFRKQYSRLFESFSQRPLNPSIDINLLRWLPMLFGVLLIATHEASEEILSADDRTTWEERLYASARTAVDYGRAVQMDNMDVMLGALLISRYTLMIRRPAEGGIPLSMSFPLGLYRDGTVLHLSDKRDIEIRRRAWAMLYHLDRSISLLIGRPPIISDAHTDTQIPANLEDEELEISFDPIGHPLTIPTQWTYIIVRHRLAVILGKIAYHTFAVKPPIYQVVLDLDGELLAWQKALPPFLAMASPDRSHDQERSHLYVQRHLLALEWYYARVTLHRPYLLRRGPHEEQFSYSQNAAIESATDDLLERRRFVMDQGTVTSSGGYRMLDSLMVLVVVIKLQVDTPRAIELQRIIDIVSGKIPDETGQISEPLGQEELSMIEGLMATSGDERRAAVVDGPIDRSGSKAHAPTLADFVNGTLNLADALSSTASLPAFISSSSPLTVPDISANVPEVDSSASWTDIFGRLSRPTAASLFEPSPLMGSVSTLDSQTGFAPFQSPSDYIFSDLGFGGPPEQRFNPFALAQSSTSAICDDQSAMDEQTALWEFLLSAIANQQPVGQ